MRLRVPLLPGWLRWGFVVLVGGFIFYTSILTVPPETAVDTVKPSLIPLDKWRHFLAYAAFAGTLDYAVTDRKYSPRVTAVAVIGITVVYGIGIEFWQSLIPARYFSMGDAYANALGGVLLTPWYFLKYRLEFVGVRPWLAGLTGGVE